MRLRVVRASLPVSDLTGGESVAASRPIPTPLEQGERALLLALFVLTLGAWALTIHQARTMDMTLGMSPGGAPRPETSATNPVESNDMAAMVMDEASAMAA